MHVAVRDPYTSACTKNNISPVPQHQCEVQLKWARNFEASAQIIQLKESFRHNISLLGHQTHDKSWCKQCKTTTGHLRDQNFMNCG